MYIVELVRKYHTWLVLIAITLFILATRLPLVLPNTIPFSFDHGKDSVAVLHMVKEPSIKFIGPWTSIPGLYFGPGWYYLLAPSFLLPMVIRWLPLFGS